MVVQLFKYYGVLTAVMTLDASLTLDLMENTPRIWAVRRVMQEDAQSGS